MASFPSHIGHSNYRAQGVSGFHQWVKKHLFGSYMVKSVQPNPNLSIKEKVIRALTDSCQWLKNNVCIPIAQRVVIWLTPKSPIEKIMTQEQNDLSQVIEEHITLLIPSRFQRMFLSTKQLNRIFKNRCNLFTHQYYETVKTACNIALNNNTLNPADKLRLLAGLRQTLIAEHRKWVNSDSRQDGELFKRINRAGHYTSDLRGVLVGALEEHLNNLITYVGERYSEEAKKCPPISGTLTGLQEKGHISRNSIYKMEKGFRELYQKTVQEKANKPSTENYKIPGTSTSMKLPEQFKLDCIDRADTLKFHFGNKTPLEIPAEPTDAQKEKIQERKTDFLEYLGEITNNNQKAIYTLGVHISQLAKIGMADQAMRIVTETLGLKLSPDSFNIKRHTDIRPDAEDPNKIVITQSISIHHNPNNEPKEQGPNGFSPDMEDMIRDQYPYMSNYCDRWLNASFKPTMKIVVDLNHPEQATVEPLDIVAAIP
ncbi:hypothetical protein [Kistimonas asteriae]|uniref:hypothetical protein n=1 Tax=Kistimonas asteriae TaxID=517724 RepID=UPI001BAD59DF|nr:hypothetical protein [Kistimonas asteriae]